jgi:cobalt-zinc-cadmium efflux system membrane fusion protein
MKIILSRKALTLAAGALVLSLAAGCSRKSETPPQHAGEQEEHKETGEHAEGSEERVVRFSDAQLKEFDIAVGTAGPGKLRIEVNLPGEIVPHADRIAHVIPRFVGVVRDVRKQVGDSVSKGEVLAVIDSNESLTPYEVKSLVDGTVIERHLVLGELIKEGVFAFVITDLREVWAELRIYQKDLAVIRKGQRAVIAAGHGVAEGQGEISYVAPMVDEKTRTGLARVVLPNPDGRWRPGLFVTARVTVDEIEAPLLIPKTALQNVDEKTCVFVQTEKGFEPRPVTLGRANDSSLEVTSGLVAGQRYVTQGAFTLKAELSKAAFGGGHAH